MKTRILILLILLTGCAQLTTESSNSHILQAAMSKPTVELQISTDSYDYLSGQQMKITITINTTQNLQNVRLQLYGIRSKYDIYKLNQEDQLNLTSGTHTLTYNYNTPTCSSCAGLSSGEYSISTKLLLDGEELATTQTMINIQR